MFETPGEESCALAEKKKNTLPYIGNLSIISCCFRDWLLVVLNSSALDTREAHLCIKNQNTSKS